MTSVQMSLFDLFREGDGDRHGELCQRWWEWLLDKRKVDAHECRHVFEDMVESLGRGEAFDRSKCLDVLSGERKVPGWGMEDIGILGLFDGSLDYHTCWDRAWAARQGWSKEKVAKLLEWDWNGKRGCHVFAE